MVSARTCFAAAFAASAFSAMVLVWYTYDVTFNGPVEESKEKAAHAFQGLGFTVALLLMSAAAFLCKESIPSRLFCVAMALFYFNSFVDEWVEFDQIGFTGRLSEDDGYKAAAVIRAIASTASAITFLVTAFMLFPKSKVSGLIALGFGLYVLSFAVVAWWVYDVQFEDSTNKDSAKAAILIAGLLSMVAWLAHLYVGALLRSEGPKLGPMLFFFGWAFFFFFFATSLFAFYDASFEEQDSESTLKAGQVFGGLGLTVAWLCFLGSGVMFKETSVAAMLFCLGFSFEVFAQMCGQWSSYDRQFNSPVEESSQKAGLVFQGLGMTIAFVSFCATAFMARKDDDGIQWYGLTE